MGLMSVIACQHLQTGADQPALLLDATPALQAQISAALTDALGVAPTIAADAFTHSSLLVIEPEVVAGGRNRAASGRTLEARVQRFRLVVNNGVCSLTRPQGRWRMELLQARCVVEQQ